MTPTERHIECGRRKHILAAEKDEIVTALRSQMTIDISAHKGAQTSRARIGVSQISIPLAWNSDLHFKNKGECRCYSMFVVLRTKRSVIDSQLVTNVDPGETDVAFDDSFVFEDEPDDFCVELSVYSTRSDGGFTGGGTLKEKLSRSFGRKFGTQVKQQMTQPLPPNAGGTNFNLLARTFLVLSDAGMEQRIHDLKLTPFADLCGPPLYGQLLCRLVAQPSSLHSPLADGLLNVKPLDGSSVYQNVRCRLQAGVLRCFVNNDVHRSPTAEHTLLLIHINEKSRCIPASHPHALLLSVPPSEGMPARQFLLTGKDESNREQWRNAIQQQINDCAMWGEFASKPTRLTSEPRMSAETLSRAGGSRLYDQIKLDGTMPRGVMITPKGGTLHFATREFSPLSSTKPSITATAPAPRRTKQRANVMHVFGGMEPPKCRDVSPAQPRYVTSLNVGESHRHSAYLTTEAPFSASYAPSKTSSYHSPPAAASVSHQPHKVRHTGSTSSAFSNYESVLGADSKGRKSWTRSLGKFIEKKMGGHTEHVTRL